MWKHICNVRLMVLVYREASRLFPRIFAWPAEESVEYLVPVWYLLDAYCNDYQWSMGDFLSSATAAHTRHDHSVPQPSFHGPPPLAIDSCAPTLVFSHHGNHVSKYHEI